MNRRPWTRALLALVALSGAAAFVAGARSCAPVPVACEPGCTDSERQEQALCGRDGATYETFCDLRCTAGGYDCVSPDDCPDVFYEGACLDVCVVPDPAGADGTPAGEPLPAFLCEDRNTRSDTKGEAFSDVVLAEQVWIAYFGSCT